MTKMRTYDKIGELLVMDEKKSSCGERLIQRDDIWRSAAG